MSAHLLVMLGEAVVGTLSRLTTGRLHFEYDDDYRRRPEATPLSVSMPLAERTHPDGTIAPWLRGLLPDNEAVLERWARENHASASSAFSLLSTPIGRDLPGAVRIAPPEEIDLLRKREGRVAWLAEEEVAQLLRELKEDATAWLGHDPTGQFSLAGAQAKRALLFRHGRWGVPTGSFATTHILKPAIRGLDDHDLNEHLCLDAARRAGLLVAHTRVARFGDESALVIERYDRRTIGGQVVRIHQEDACQALGVPPSRKYQNERGPGPKDIVQLFRRAMPARAANDAARRFVDALIWNWLIGGTDAHAKNYSLLLSADQIRLAPLYDIASALPYGVHEKKLRFAMKIGYDYQVWPRRNPWPRLARDLTIDPDMTVERVRALAALAPDAFADAARSREVAALRSPLSARLADLVAVRVVRCRRLVG